MPRAKLCLKKENIMNKLLIATLISTSISLSNPTHAMSEDLDGDGEIHFCEQNALTLGTCLFGFASLIGLIAGIADMADPDKTISASERHEDSMDFGKISSGESKGADPTPEYSLPHVEPQYDEHEKGCLWGSRLTDTC